MPPLLQELGSVLLIQLRLGLTLIVKLDVPGFGSADEVNDLNIVTKAEKILLYLALLFSSESTMSSLLFKGWKICISCCGTHVVEEGQVLRDVLSCPGTEKSVEQALISPVE